MLRAPKRHEILKDFRRYFRKFGEGDGGSFYNVSFSGFFCALFTQCCHVSVNTTGIGLVVVELFLSFSRILLNFWTIVG